MDKALLLGARGMLGRRLREVLARRYRVIPTAHHAVDDVAALDVCDFAAVRAAVEESRPAVVVNAAAYTAVDRAETESDLAWRVNALAPGFASQAAHEVGAVIVHVSTDFVFDGNTSVPYVETDPVAPKSAYGRTKEAGERLVRERNPRHVIARTQWLYGPDGRHFAATMVRLAREGKPLRVVKDQTGAPTYAPDVAEQILRIMDAGLLGTIHVANRGQATWHAFAEAILKRAGLDVGVTPISTAEFGAPAVRPAFSVLRNAVLEATIGNLMRPWDEALDAFAATGGLK